MVILSNQSPAQSQQYEGREICSKLTIKTPEKHLKDDNKDIVLVSLLSTFNIFHTFF